MNNKLNLLATVSLFTLGLSMQANASITASVELVCEKAGSSLQTTQSGDQIAENEYSSTLTSHFSATSCGGKQLLETIRNAKKSNHSLDEVRPEMVQVAN